MPQWLVNILVNYVLPNLVSFFFAFVKNLQAARADDPTLIATIEQIVVGLNQDHPDWAGAQKRSYAFDAAQAYLKGAGKDVGTSVINTLIELAVQKQTANTAN